MRGSTGLQIELVGIREFRCFPAGCTATVKGAIAVRGGFRDERHAKVCQACVATVVNEDISLVRYDLSRNSDDSRCMEDVLREDLREQDPRCASTTNHQRSGRAMEYESDQRVLYSKYSRRSLTQVLIPATYASPTSCPCCLSFSI